MGQCPVERQWSQDRVIPGAGPVKRLRDRPAGRHRQEPAQAHPVLAQAYQRFLAQTGLTLEPEPPYTSDPSLSTSVALLTAAMVGPSSLPADCRNSYAGYRPVMAAMKAWPSQGEVTTMRDPGHAPIQAGPQRRWIRTVRAYLHEPAVLTIIAVAFFISAAGQRFGSPRPRSWSLSRGPGLIDSDLIDAARMAEVLGQAVEEAGGARLDRSGRRRTILR